MTYKITFSEKGHTMSTSYTKDNSTEQDVIDWFGLNEPDIDWYKIEKICK